MKASPLVWTFFLSLSVLAVPRAESSEPALPDLFPWQAQVLYEEGGLVRIELPPEVLSRCGGDLADLRVFDAADREVPYLVDSGVPEDTELEIRERVQAETLGVDRTTTREEGIPVRTRQVLELAPPPEREGSWDLVVDFAEPVRELVRQARVEGIGADGSVSVLVTGSIFRLPGAGGELARLSLGRLDPAQHRKLRLILEGEDGRFLTPELHYERRETVQEPIGLTVPLAISSVRKSGEMSLLTLDRPAGVVPDRLRIVSSTPLYDRAVAVWDERRGEEDRYLGMGRILRVPGGDDAISVSEVRIAVPRGERLRLEVQDGSSPPLEDVKVEALLRQPALVLALPSGPGARLRFGGGRTHRPRYDLESLRPRLGALLEEHEAAATRALYETGALTKADLGPVESNPGFSAQPALGWAMRPGAELDPRTWKWWQRAEWVPSQEGLASLALPAETLSKLRPDLADLRVVDDQDRQWPYLLERHAADILVDCEVELRERPGVSRYRIVPADSPLPVTGLVLETGTRFFDRAYTLTATTPDGETRRVASGRLARKVREFVPVRLSFPQTWARSLELEIQDGDDAPLRFATVQWEAPQPEIYLPAPEGGYALLLGEPEIPSPTYDIARARNLILAVKAARGELGAVQENPEYSFAARATRGGGPTRLLLWGLIVLAVLILGGMTLRLARTE